MKFAISASLKKFLNRTSGDAIGIAVETDRVVAVRTRQRASAPPLFLALSAQPAASSDLNNAAFWDKLLAPIGKPPARLALALPDPPVRLTQINVPEMPEAEKRQALTFLVSEIDGTPPEALVCDYVDVPALRRPSAEPPVYCASARLQDLRPLIEAIQSSDRPVALIEPVELALRRLSWWCEAESGANALYCLVNAKSSRLVIANPERFYLFRYSRIGSDAFAEDAAGAAMALGLDIQRTLDFYDGQFADPPPQHLWLVPPEPGLAEPMIAALEGELRLPMRALTPEPLGIPVQEGQELPLAAAAVALAASAGALGRAT